MQTGKQRHHLTEWLSDSLKPPHHHHAAQSGGESEFTPLAIAPLPLDTRAASLPWGSHSSQSGPQQQFGHTQPSASRGSRSFLPVQESGQTLLRSTHTSVALCLCVSVCVDGWAWKCVCLCIYVCMYVYRCMTACVCTQMCVCIYTHKLCIHICVYIYVCVYIVVCVYARFIHKWP